MWVRSSGWNELVMATPSVRSRVRRRACPDGTLAPRIDSELVRVSTPTRAFVGRLTELHVFDPLGDQVGRVRDVVVTFNVARSRPRVIGLVVEVAGRRRVFVPMTRVTSVEGGQVIVRPSVKAARQKNRKKIAPAKINTGTSNKK